MKPAEIIRRLRVIGVEPNDYPPAVLERQSELVGLYKKQCVEKSTLHKDAIRTRSFMRMTPQVRLTCMCVYAMD